MKYKKNQEKNFIFERETLLVPNYRVDPVYIYEYATISGACSHKVLQRRPESPASGRTGPVKAKVVSIMDQEERMIF